MAETTPPAQIQGKSLEAAIEEIYRTFVETPILHTAYYDIRQQRIEEALRLFDLPVLWENFPVAVGRIKANLEALLPTPEQTRASKRN